MTASTINDTSSPSAPVTYQRSELGGNNSFFGVIRSELIKMRSLKSSWILMVTALVVYVGIAALSAWAMGAFMGDVVAAAESGAVPAEASGPSVFNFMASSGWQLAVLLLCSLAIINISAEYVTGAARTTFAATPRRWPVFWAKALVVAVVSFVISLAGMLLAALAVEPIAKNYGFSQDFNSEMFQKQIWWVPVVVMVICLMSFGVAAIIRNAVGPIMLVVTVIFVLPTILSVFQNDIMQNILNWLPTSLATVLMGQSMGLIDVEFWPAFFALLAWGLVPLIVGAVLTQKRDI